MLLRLLLDVAVVAAKPARAKAAAGVTAVVAAGAEDGAGAGRARAAAVRWRRPAQRLMRAMQQQRQQRPGHHLATRVVSLASAALAVLAQVRVATGGGFAYGMCVCWGLVRQANPRNAMSPQLFCGTVTAHLLCCSFWDTLSLACAPTFTSNNSLVRQCQQPLSTQLPLLLLQTTAWRPCHGVWSLSTSHTTSGPQTHARQTRHTQVGTLVRQCVTHSAAAGW